MQSVQTTEQIYYNSVFRHGVDTKRRLQIPARWLPAAGEVEFTLIVWPKSSVGECLRAMPPKEMSELMALIDSMPSTDPNKTVLKRIIGSESIQVAVDKGGRISLPEDMVRRAAIGDEAVLVGLLDRFEIWNPERYEKVKSADAVMASEAFKLME
jgi:MraZ protein